MNNQILLPYVKSMTTREIVTVLKDLYDNDISLSIVFIRLLMTWSNKLLYSTQYAYILFSRN